MSTSNKSARLTAHDQLMFCADGLLDHYSLLPPPTCVNVTLSNNMLSTRTPVGIDCCYYNEWVLQNERTWQQAGSIITRTTTKSVVSMINFSSEGLARLWCQLISAT